ncbi:unnamed protein product [Schistosoma rodhaini]|uniref:Uncharacterized protein n=1 Tax=Schistosoma rodhaini TaxID=6188 RepID=A0AA85GA29_9TREM|nr:unnamed protein product [Schistosoma rodhaini]
MIITTVIISLLLLQSFQSTGSSQSTTTPNGSTSTPSAWDQFKNGFHLFLDFLCTLNSFWQTIKSIFSYIF